MYCLPGPFYSLEQLRLLFKYINTEQRTNEGGRLPSGCCEKNEQDNNCGWRIVQQWKGIEGANTIGLFIDSADARVKNSESVIIVAGGGDVTLLE